MPKLTPADLIARLPEIRSFYENDPAHTIPKVAEHFNARRSDISFVFAMNNIPIRRGNPNLGADPNMRAASLSTRRSKSLPKLAAKLAATYNRAELIAALDSAYMSAAISEEETIESA